MCTERKNVNDSVPIKHNESKISIFKNVPKMERGYVFENAADIVCIQVCILMEWSAMLHLLVYIKHVPLRRVLSKKYV